MKKDFVVRQTRQKNPASYKSLYIKDSLLKEVEKIADKNTTSFNNVVISMNEPMMRAKNKTRKLMLSLFYIDTLSKNVSRSYQVRICLIFLKIIIRIKKSRI